jgi:hypothetical protein
MAGLLIAPDIRLPMDHLKGQLLLPSIPTENVEPSRQQHRSQHVRQRRRSLQLEANHLPSSHDVSNRTYDSDNIAAILVSTGTAPMTTATATTTRGGSDEHHHLTHNYDPTDPTRPLQLYPERQVVEDVVQMETNVTNGNNSNNNNFMLWHTLCQYPVTSTILCTVHGLYYVRCCVIPFVWKRRQRNRMVASSTTALRTSRSIRNRNRRRRNVSNDTGSGSGGGVTYRILMEKKQWYKWWMAVFMIVQPPPQQQQPQSPVSSNEGPTGTTEDASSSVVQLPYHDTTTTTILPVATRRRDHASSSRATWVQYSYQSLRSYGYHLRRITVSIRSIGAVVCDQIRQLWNDCRHHYSTTDMNTDRIGIMERVQIVSAEIVHHYPINNSPHWVRFKSVLVLVYISHLLWSCRALEEHYRSIDTVVDSLPSSLVSLSSWSYFRVWIGVGICATVLDLSMTYYFILILSEFRRTLIYYARRQNQNSNDVLNTGMSVSEGDDNHSINSRDDVSGSDNGYHSIIQKWNIGLRTRFIHVNMTQIVSYTISVSYYITHPMVVANMDIWS